MVEGQWRQIAAGQFGLAVLKVDGTTVSGPLVAVEFHPQVQPVAVVLVGPLGAVKFDPIEAFLAKSAMKKARQKLLLWRAFRIGATGFEPATS